MLPFSNELFNKLVTIEVRALSEQLRKGAAAFDLSTDYHGGTKKGFGFLDDIGSMIGDRDITANDNAVESEVSGTSKNVPKHFWTSKLIHVKASDLKSYLNGKDQETAFATYAAKQYSKAMVMYMYNIGIGAAVAAIGQNTDTTFEAAAFNYSGLNSELAKFGDSSMLLKTLAMKGKQYHELVGVAAGAEADVSPVLGASIISGNPASFGKSVMQYDTTALTDGTKDLVLALVDNAIGLRESEERLVYFTLNGTKKNARYEMKFEGAFDVEVKGFSYTGANAEQADLLTAANWNRVDTLKATAGVLGKFGA